MLRRLRSPGAGVVVLVLLLAEELTQKQYTVLRSHKSVLQRQPASATVDMLPHPPSTRADSNSFGFSRFIFCNKKVCGKEKEEIGRIWQLWDRVYRERERKKEDCSFSHSFKDLNRSWRDNKELSSYPYWDFSSVCHCSVILSTDSLSLIGKEIYLFWIWVG